MNNKIEVLGVKFDNVNMAEAIQKCEEMLDYSTKGNLIVTPNPEIVMKAKDDPEYLEIINNASLVIPDGIGIIKGAEMLNTPLKERVAGYDLICNLLEKYSDGSKSFFFWGGKPGIAELAEKKMLEKYPNINILGSEDGYFDDKKKAKIIQRLKELKPDILLVGVGFPKQEMLINELLDEDIFKIAIGCGGSLDVLSGTVKRAPKLFIKAHLEWAWRLLKEPTRIGRMMVLPKFMKEVKKEAKAKHVYKPKHIPGFEKSILEFFSNNMIVFAFILISILAIALRVSVIEHEAWDYHQFLQPWTEQIIKDGGFASLGDYPGDYTPPYIIILTALTYLPVSSLISIKAVSFFFDFLLAIACGKLVHHVVKHNKPFFFVLTYGVVLILPLVFLNSAFWGQCDNIYTTFVILSLLYMLKEKYFRSFLFLGIAFAFKLQFIFILPLYVILYFKKKDFSILYFLLLPITLIVLSLPSLMQGMTLENLFSIYVNQANEYSGYLTLNFPSIYSIIHGEASLFVTFGIILTISVCGLMMFYCAYNKSKLTDEIILNLGLWSIMMTTFLLPCMHERYLFMGEVLSVVIFIAYKKNIFVPLALQIISLIDYSNYLFGSVIENSLPILTIIYAIVIVIHGKKITEMMNAGNNNKLIKSKS